MRIRKHAKISPLLHAAAPPSLAPCSLLQTHVCQLNQSPWDAMKFSPPPTPPPPPPPHQGDGDGVSDGDGSSGRRGSAPVSFSDREEEDQQLEYCSDAETKAAASLCCKTDGRSWQCRREAAADSTLCEHHILQAKSYTGLSLPVAKKPAGKVAARRAQAKKASAAANASNPYEFYYYSGFGPRWGKKRGEKSNDNSNDNVSGSTRKSVERKREDDEFERAVAASLNEMDSDEYDEEEWNRGNMGKKRVRKPIKARSLKSLM